MTTNHSNDNLPTTYIHINGGEKEESEQSRARNAPKNHCDNKIYFREEVIM